MELSHHKYSPESKSTLPDGKWEEWAPKPDDAPEKRIDIAFRNGLPWEGRVWAHVGENGPESKIQWLVFKEGQLSFESKNGPDVTVRDSGDFDGNIQVTSDFNLSGHVTIKSSRIWSGKFFGVTYADGKAIGRTRPRSAQPFFSEKLHKLLLAQAAVEPAGK